MYHKLQTAEVLGSDGNRYLIEYERIGYNELELSLIPIKIKVSKGDYEFSSRVNTDKELVERYISKIKHEHGPDRRTLLEIHNRLVGSKVDNHFDYLAVLQKVLPRLEKLLQ